MVNELLRLCDEPVAENASSLSMSKKFAKLYGIKNSPLIIPLQESLTVNLPASAVDDSTYKPFPPGAPTFLGIWTQSS
jgi:serine/threonine-protein kinase ATR